MSLFILDTDTLTLYERGHARVLQKARSVSPADLALTIISIEEQLSGWYSALRRVTKPDLIARVYERFTQSIRFLSGIQAQFLSFPLPAILRFNALVKLKLNVGKMDLRIAAIALEHGAVVVTRNIRDFGRVPYLTIEDWSV